MRAETLAGIEQLVLQNIRQRGTNALGRAFLISQALRREELSAVQPERANTVVFVCDCAGGAAGTQGGCAGGGRESTSIVSRGSNERMGHFSAGDELGLASCEVTELGQPPIFDVSVRFAAESTAKHSDGARRDVDNRGARRQEDWLQEER